MSILTDLLFRISMGLTRYLMGNNFRFIIKGTLKGLCRQIRFIQQKYQKNQYPTTRELIQDLKDLKNFIDRLYYATDGAIEPLYSEIVEYINNTIKLLENQSKTLPYNINDKTYHYHFYK